MRSTDLRCNQPIFPILVLTPSWFFRTPESTQIQKVENFQIFIRTVSGNFYPDGGSGLRYGQFLSGHRSGLPKTAIFAFSFKTLIFRSTAPLEPYYTSYKHLINQDPTEIHSILLILWPTQAYSAGFFP